MITEATVRYEWRGSAEEVELDWLHAEAFDHPPEAAQWQRQLEHHSLGWVCARRYDELVGFANVIWDGGIHAVLLDTMVLPVDQGQGIGTEIVRVAAVQARRSGCEWLHADFARDLAAFYLEQCGFTPTEAGLLNLREAVVDADIEEVASTDEVATGEDAESADAQEGSAGEGSVPEGSGPEGEAPGEAPEQ